MGGMEKTVPPISCFPYFFKTSSQSICILQLNDRAIAAFQFQYGTVSKGLLLIPKDFHHMFQFQCGTIKRVSLFHPFCNLNYFNSNVVRLKEYLLTRFPHGKSISIPMWYD